MLESITAAQLEGNSSCPPYGRDEMSEHGQNGTYEPEPLSPTTTWAVSTIISCLQPKVALGDVTGVVIQNNGVPEDGSGSLLTPPDWATPQTDFNDPTETPVISYAGSSNLYNRPWRGGSDEDLDDQVNQSAPITIEVFEGPLLTVKAGASQTTVPVGTSISFTADVTSGGDGSTPQYSWNFDGGAANSTQENPTVTFSTAGTWDVSVLATDQSGGGGSAEIPITVTSPDAPASSNTGTAPSGPQTSAGTTPGGPAGTRTTGGSTPTGRPKTEKQTGQTTTGHPSGHRSTQTGHQTQTTSTTSTTSAGPGGSSGSSGSGTGSGGGASSSSPATATTPSRGATTPSKAPTHRPPPPVSPSTGTLVTGRLISDVVPLTASVSPLVHDVPSPTGSAPALRPPRSTSVLPVVAGILAVIVLLTLGATRELGWPRRPPVPHVSA